MNKILWAPFSAVGIGLMASTAAFATCTVPNTIANGQVADATKVMGNFTALANCAQQGNLTGDVTTSGGAAATLSNSGVTAGTYSSPTIVVDTKGRITSASTGSGGTGAMGLLQSKTASNSSSLDFTSAISGAYDDYVVDIVGLVLSDDGSAAEILFSSDNGATWDTAANYDTSMTQTNQGTFSSNASLDSGSYGQITQGYASLPTNALSGRLEIMDTGGSRYKLIPFQAATAKTDGNFYSNVGTIRYKSTSIINAIRIKASSGTLVSGSVRLYGISH